MPSLDDMYNELKQINTNLTSVQGDLTQINNTLATGFKDVMQDMQALVMLGAFADQALSQLSKQDDTIVCILEKISKMICDLLNETHVQTGLQSSIKKSNAALLEIQEFVHSDAALESRRLHKLHEQVLECCPPEEPPPICTYEPCPAPPPLGAPPEPERPIQ